MKGHYTVDLTHMENCLMEDAGSDERVSFWFILKSGPNFKLPLKLPLMTNYRAYFRYYFRYYFAIRMCGKKSTSLLVMTHNLNKGRANWHFKNKIDPWAGL